MVENREIFIPHLYLAPPQEVTPSEFRDAGKTGMIGLPYSEKNYDDMLSRFHLIPERYGQTDRQRDRFAISISLVSMLTRYKNAKKLLPVQTGLVAKSITSPEMFRYSMA